LRDVPLTEGLGATRVHQPPQDDKDVTRRDARELALLANEALTCCI